jgi:hypothetical protein
MPPVTNTMETERRLEQMGFPAPQARGLAGLFEETATAVQQDLKTFIAAQTELIRSEMRAMEERLRAEIRLSEERLRVEIKGTEGGLRKEIRWLLFWFISIQTVLTGSFFTLWQIFISRPGH